MKKPNCLTPKDVYVIGAGFSAGLGFPLISSLLRDMWPRLSDKGYTENLSKVIRFHHPGFNPRLKGTYPTVEELLSEMQANEDLFTSSREGVGGFSRDDLINIRRGLLVEIADWFHDIKSGPDAIKAAWPGLFVAEIKKTRAKVISFNWDLVLDELLFGDSLDASSYGFGKLNARPLLIKPHGSLNWYHEETAIHIKGSKTFDLYKRGKHSIKVFKQFRAVKSKSGREYMPLIVPPVYAKQFSEAVFQKLWLRTVNAISTASRVVFVGYSMANADFHARFILRCGFYNQEHGRLGRDGKRLAPTGRAEVVVVDPSDDGPARIAKMLGRDCTHLKTTAQEWIDRGMV